MNVRLAGFAIAVSLFLLILVGAALFFWWRARRMTSTEDSLQDLLARVHVLDRSRISALALDTEGGELETSQVWETIGGLQGLQAMAENCDVLIQLAFHVQQFYPEAVATAEQLRLNAREIQWHLERLRGAEGRGNLRTVFPDYAQRAVTIYYGMTQNLLELYRTSQIPGASQLEAVL